MPSTLLSKENVLNFAAEKIEQGSFLEAETLLQEFISHIPSSWNIEVTKGKHIIVHSWDQDEFCDFIQESCEPEKYKCSFISYPRAFYLLSIIAIENKEFGSALFYINKGISLQADHPRLLCKKGDILCKIGNKKEAKSFYSKAFQATHWNNEKIKSEAMHKAGMVLADMDEVEEASKILSKVLEIDPGHQGAMNELSNIHLNHMKVKSEKKFAKFVKWKMW